MVVSSLSEVPLRIATVVVASIVVLTTASAAAGQEPGSTPPPGAATSTPAPSDGSSAPVDAATEAPGESSAADDPPTAPDTVTPSRHEALRAAVAARAVAEARLPRNAAGESCAVDDIELAWAPMDPAQFERGGFVEPLIEPGPDAPDRATGIARCVTSSHAVAGFDAFRTGAGWDVHFVSPSNDAETAPSAGHDAASPQTQADTDALRSAPPDAVGITVESVATNVTAQAVGSAVPSPPEWPAGMPTTAEPLPNGDTYSSCDPTDKPGAVALADLLTATYGTTVYGISRDCSIGGNSEHKEGRAVDWIVNAFDPVERQMGDQLTEWVLGADPWGNDHAGMRRLGIMYMIWNGRGVYSWAVEDGWRTYTGSSPHTDHVHFSMSWPGARCETSFWVATGCTGDVGTPPAPPAPADPDPVQSGVRADFDGDGNDDVLWYGPGADYDTMWYGESGGFDKSPNTRVKGTYVPLVGDFGGDGRADILWYGPGGDKDARWDGRATPGGFTTNLPFKVKGVYEPLVGDFDGNGVDDVFWYGPGGNRDSVWFGTTSGWRHPGGVNVNGEYEPAVGDFNGDGRDDILWYGPGGDYDTLWVGRSDRTFATSGLPDITIDAEPLTGDFDGDGYDDVFFYGEGNAPDAWWRGGPGANFTVRTDYPVQGAYRPFTGDFDGDGRDDLFWYGPGDHADWIYYGQSGGFAPEPEFVRGIYVPVSGD